MKKYVEAKLNIIYFTNEDIITASGEEFVPGDNETEVAELPSTSATGGA